MAVRSQDKERELRSPILPQDVIDNVRIFIVFLGYPRSGHTILGALMDAHPNMVISHQYNPCVHSRSSNKSRLFNEMYRNSYKNAMDINGARGQNYNKKNYTAYVANSWQGNYDKYIRVIGGKKIKVSVTYLLMCSIQFTESYRLQSNPSIWLEIHLISDN
jgi:hypothetical protein